MWICVTPKSVSVNNSYKIPKQKKKAERKREKGRDCTARWAKKVRLCAGSSRGNCRHGYILPAAAPWFPGSNEFKTGGERQRDRWSGSYCSERLRTEMLYYRQRHRLTTDTTKLNLTHQLTVRLKTAWNGFALHLISLMPCTWPCCCISLYSSVMINSCIK